MSLGAVARRAGRALARVPAVSAAARSLARRRDHRLVLVYHRLGPSPPPDATVVPTVPTATFRSQLEALAAAVDLVTLDQVLAGGEGRRPRVALTFDDDLPSHVDEVLPVIEELGVPAAFFLSGRALHGLGAYWFQELEAVLGAHGPEHTAGRLGLPTASPAALGLACEREEGLRRRVAELAAGLPAPAVLTGDEVARLAAAGMTVGFHTVEHGIMPEMSDGALHEAASRGCDELAAVTGRAPRYFTYPHGKADRRVAAAVRQAGFVAAWTGRPAPLRPRDDRYLLGRWEPGPIGPEELLAGLAIRLHRSAPPSAEALM
jgi:peptidoglycan/xylan/chitin deacetylase (PgdA/CDA1 family)